MGTFGSYLRSEYESRRARNKRYSIRAFAKSIGISPASLSRILSGRQSVSAALILKTGKKLGLSPAQIEKFQALLQESIDLKTKKPFLLETDTFVKIWNLYHYAILNLLKTNSFRPDFHWMAKVLGLKKSEVEEMWGRLLDAQLIQKGEDGKWIRTHANTTNIKKTKVAPAGYKDLQIQILNEAIKSLFEELSDRRDHSAITIPIDSKRIPDAREKIAQFRKEMTAFMATESPDQVYTMSIALFPLTKL